MPKDNKLFFKQKKLWSEVKDELLGCYLVPYLNKVMTMNMPILYVDCFAGKGKFDDGKDGSPLIAVQCLSQCLSTYHPTQYISRVPNVMLKFIELNHANDLRRNLSTSSATDYEVIDGRFEDNIIPILQTIFTKYRSVNVFLYIDPYGIKALNTPLFVSLPYRFSTAELLINLNSFGFIREACRVMKVNFREQEDEIMSDLVEYDNSHMQSIDELNMIAGGDYWQKIISDYNGGTIDCYDAEKSFAQQYRDCLRKSYRYVLDMPIRLKPSAHPKYRLIHATNHPEGCILMADNMAKRTDRLLVEIQSKGQMSLFSQTADNILVDENTIDCKMRLLLSVTSGYIHLNELLAVFFNEFGVLCGSPQLSSGKTGSCLKRLEKSGEIEVLRNPQTTPTGRPSSFWNESRNNEVLIRRKLSNG